MPSNFNRRAHRKQQTRLKFDPVDGSPPTKMSPARIRYELRNPQQATPSRSQPREKYDDGSNDELSPVMRAPTNKNDKRRQPLPIPVKSSQSQINAADFRGLEVDDSSSESQPEQKRYNLPRKKKGKDTGLLRIEGEELSQNSEGKMAVSNERQYMELSSDSEHTQLPGFSFTGKCTENFSSVKKYRSQTTNILGDDSDSGEIVSKSPIRRSSKVAKVIDDENDFQDPIQPLPQLRSFPQQISDTEDEGENPISSTLKRRRVAEESDDDSDIIIFSSPRRRKRNFDDDAEPNSDLEFPSKTTSPHQTTPPVSRVTRRGRAKRHYRNEKEKILELLKRKRAGEDIDELTASSDPESDKEDSDQGFQHLSDFEDDPEDRTSKFGQIQKTQKPLSNEEHTDSDFIVDDEDDPLGVPDTMHQMPLHFTHAAHKPLKEHFKDAVEWLVQKKLNPDFQRKDPIYIRAFLKLNDEYGGYAKSKFVSTQWTTDFTRAIYARPHLLVRELAPGEGMSVTGEEKCDVCNHKSHHSSFEIQFQGRPYDKETLEDLEQDSEDEADSEDDNLAYNADGQWIVSENKKWFSGRTCKANAEQAHTLIHWKYALNNWVTSNLEQEGYLSSTEFVKRESLSVSKRNNYAIEVVDKWEKDRQIKDLFRDFKLQLEAAREAKQDRNWG